jgi:hypothetical protein
MSRNNTFKIIDCLGIRALADKDTPSTQVATLNNPEVSQPTTIYSTFIAQAQIWPEESGGGAGPMASAEREPLMGVCGL